MVRDRPTCGVKDLGMYGNLLRGSRELSRPTTGCKAVWSATGRRAPKPSMNGREKSDSLLVPRKPTNKTGQPAAEPVEGSDGAKRNATVSYTHLTLPTTERV